MDKVEPKQQAIDAFAEKLEAETEIDTDDEVETEVMEPVEADFIEAEFDEAPNVGEMIPTMNVNAMPMAEQSPCIVADEKLLNLYDEIVENCRADREKVNQIQETFEEMVVNEGDATSASKEALVNLIKIKTDINDKLSKVADLMTRVHLKEKNTFPAYMAVHQHNNVTHEVSNKREILKSLQQQKRKNG